MSEGSRPTSAEPADTWDHLVSEIHRGAPGSFEKLDARLRPLLTRWARRTSQDPGSDVDDLCQQIIVRVYRGLPTYDARKGSFLPWLFAVARNELSTQRRRRPKDAPLAPAELDRRRDLQERLSTDIGSDVWKVLVQAELAQALTSLTDREATVLALRYVVDLSLGEVAARLDVSPDAVSQAQLRALRKLRAAYRARSDGGVVEALSVRRLSAGRLPSSRGRRRLHVFTSLPVQRR